MDGLISIYNSLQPKFGMIVDAAAYLCLFASVIVKITPTLKDDNYFKHIIKFIGKYVALDKYGPKGESALNAKSN